VKLFYAVRSADLAANPPPASHHAIQTPALVAGVQWSLVIVEDWSSPAAQDAWENIPGVIELHPWKWAGVIPTAMVTAFAPWGVSAGDTIDAAFRKIRSHWPACRAN
jgi:hypothetical protein